jgi:predicted nucleic acid-binding protein
MKIVLDTNFLYSLLIRDSFNHKEAIALLKTKRGKLEFLIPVIVFVELAAAERYRPDVMSLLDSLDFEIISHTETDTDLINTFDTKIRQVLKAGDCLISSTCLKEDAELLTLDKKLKRFARRLGIKVS